MSIDLLYRLWNDITYMRIFMTKTSLGIYKMCMKQWPQISTQNLLMFLFMLNKKDIRLRVVVRKKILKNSKTIFAFEQGTMFDTAVFRFSKSRSWKIKLTRLV